MLNTILLLSAPVGAGYLRAAQALEKALLQKKTGPEERSANQLQEEGMAVRCNHLPVLGYKADKRRSNPIRLKEMQRKARRLSRPRDALDIIDTLTRLQLTDQGTH